MAKFTSRWGPENFTFLSRKTTLTRTPVFNFSLNKLHPHLHSLPSLKFRVLCSIKEKENVKDTEKVPEVLTGLRVNEFDKPGSGPESGLIGIGHRGRILLKGINSLERRRWPLLFATWIRYLIIYNCFCFWFMSLTFSIFRL
jgi:hypothetical protein